MMIPDVRQFVRFLVVGVSNTLISFIVYRLLLAVSMPYAVAAPLSFAAGALNGYILNRRWTFDARDTTRARVLYVSFAALGAFFTTVFVVLFVRAFDVGRVEAYIVAVPPVTVSLFLANRLWTFAERREGSPASG
jgi:putative flippase GtrA